MNVWPVSGIQTAIMAVKAGEWLTAVACAAAWLSWSPVVQAEPPPGTGDAVKVVPAPTTNSIDPAPPPVGGAAVSWRLMGADDAGTWAVRPGRFVHFDPQIATAGGEIRLDPRLSILLYGAEEFMLHRFSGMTGGLLLRLLPQNALFQPTLSAGYSEDLGVSQVLWGRLGTTIALGSWRLGYALRAATPIGDGAATQPGLVASAAVTYEQRRYSLGFEALREWRPGLPARTVFSPSVSVKPSETTEVRASSGISPQGASSPFKISFVNRF